MHLKFGFLSNVATCSIVSFSCMFSISIKLGTTADEMVNCNPTEKSACNTQPAHTHMEKQFSHPKIAKLQKGTFAKWFLDKEKHYNDTYRTITKILQNRKKVNR